MNTHNNDTAMARQAQEQSGTGIYHVKSDQREPSPMILSLFNGDLLHRIEMTGYSCSFSIPSCNFYIAVNRHNYYPYVKSYMVSEYIQNVEFNESAIYVSTPLQIGYDVTTSVPYGNVVVKNGAKLSIMNGTGDVTIKNGFECENGAELVIE